MSAIRPFRFAVQIGALDEAEAIASSARTAESLGYDELYSFDHMGSADPFIPLMIAAAATTRLRVGPLVLNNEFHHPALLARTAATVDRLTGGRLVLGLGTGYAQAEHDAIGLTLRSPADRVSRLRECVAALNGLLQDGSHHVDGVHHRLSIDALGIAPAQAHVPLLIGGHGRRVVALAAEYADIFQFTGLTHGVGGLITPGGFDLASVALRARWLDDALPGRNDSIERSALVQSTYVGDRAAERNAAAAARMELPAPVVADTPFLLHGSVEQLVDKLERLRETLGISHLVIRDPHAFAPVVAALAER